jgi:hypothetical protein
MEADGDEARAILAEELGRLRAGTHRELVERLLGRPETIEVTGPSGVTYQVELQAFSDAGTPGNLRVLAAIDDGGFRAFVPLTEDFIVAPDGSFVGE